MKKSHHTHDDETARSDPSVAAETGGDAALEEQLAAAVAQRDANHDRWMRAVADLENYRKRVQKDAEQDRLYQALPLVRDLLPGLDNLKRAVAAAELAGQSGELATGVKLVVKQIEDVLAAHAVQPLEAVGHPFDPNLHEAVQQAPSSEHPPMTVIEELERGYRLNDRVIRPTKVIVSTNPKHE